ncbi:MAG TPA: hypothetical protein VG738_21220 [Chitinophagaceae bacterium]|nr:hypothetical protein [Chitinophagaceae bacterium]
MGQKNKHAQRCCRWVYYLLCTCIFNFLLHNFCAAQDISSLAKQKPFAISGAVQLRGVYYTASGIPANRSPYSYIFSGNPTFSIYGLSVPLNFTVSEQERSFRQPFNQFGISPHYKWITVHLGYRSVVFSPYTLAGYTMLGAGVELNPGKFRFGFMYGKLASATTLDTTTQSLVPFSFSRKAYAVRIGVGTDRTYFDISYLKAKDDDASVPYKTYDSFFSITPAANTVIGVSTRVSFFRKLYIQGNIAGSIYTRDINSPITLDSFDNSLFKLAKKFAIVNASTEFNIAADAAIGYKATSWGVKVQYNRIDPDFQSMGAYFFNNDLESYTVAPNFRLFKNKLRFSGSIGFQHDNVKNQKQATSNKTIGTANLSVDFTSKFGVDVNYSNFSNNQQPNTIRFADSLKIAQTTQNMSVSPRYIFTNTKSSHAIIASVNLMKLNDFNNYFAQNAISRNINFSQYFINYTYGIIASQLSLSLNISSTKMDAAGTTDNNKGGTLSITKSLFKSVLSVNGSAGYFFDKRNDGTSNIVNLSSNIQYTFLKKHGLNFLFYYTNNKPKNISAVLPGFNETRAELGYQYNF